MQRCITCFKEKDLSEFIYPSSRHSFSSCKKCRSTIGKVYKNLKEESFTFIKLCIGCNKFFPKTTEFFFKKLKSVSNKCKTCSLKVNHSYYSDNSRAILEQKQKYYKENINSIKEYREDYKKSEKASTYYKNQYIRRRNNPLEYLKKNISSRILNCFKSNSLRKNKLTLNILGCTREGFYKYLIKTFENNYKISWKETYLQLVEIDHILPISLAINESDIYELNHYSNLQFLFSTDNILKSNDLDWKLDLSKTKLYDKIKDLEHTNVI